MAAKKQKKVKPHEQAASGSEAQPSKKDIESDVAQVETRNRAAEKLIVVGMGASAGGLDAFKKFFSAMPKNSGLAFVLIPHLAPNHASLMVELLARQTAMPVVEVEDKQHIEADRVYIIPPNKYMRISGGVLQLTGPVERRLMSTPIDLFLRSLAEDEQERAICIILSGTGTHGTLGLKAVKANGGMAMVQDPTSAEYDGMPLSAVATGLADFVLAPGQMPESLVKYVQHFHFSGGAPAGAATVALDDLSHILELLRTQTKYDFNCYRKKMLRRRIERRIGLHQIKDLPAYLAYLRTNPDEIKRLTRDLFISVTSFFRDPEAFDTLKTLVLHKLIETKEAEAPVRVWVPAAASGEEAYSLAIMLLECQRTVQRSGPLQIFATDVDQEALEAARLGIYPDSIFVDVSAERLAHFFTRSDENSYQVNKAVRQAVVFAAQNLIADPPFSKLDFISCRNLLIYLEPAVQKKVINLLHFALNEGGYLMLGPSETIGREVDLFEPVNKKWRIYRRIGSTRPDRVEFPVTYRKKLGAGKLGIDAGPGGSRVNFADLTHALLLDAYAPAALLINRRNEILYFFGQTTRYLNQPTGEPTRDVMLLAREGLRTKLRVVINKALRDNQPVAEPGVRIHRDGHYASTTVSARPVQSPGAAEGLLLVTFVDEAEPPRTAPLGDPVEVNDTLVRQLEYELKTTREDLQSSVEEFENSTEELKVANEEVMSINEELQSANEELETSKEELQSLNEELNTVNSQLQDKVEDLETAANDMTNLLNCTDIGTVFLDTQFRIKRFTPAATGLFNLIATDVGRPIGDIVQNFTDPHLQDDARQVLQRLTAVEKQVVTRNGRWCLRRLNPYRTTDNRIEGVVISFVDITQQKSGEEALRQLSKDLEQRVVERTAELEKTNAEQKRMEKALRESRNRLAAIVDTAGDALITIDERGVIDSFNKTAEAMFGYRSSEVVGENVNLLMPAPYHQEHAGYLRNYLTTGVKKIIGIGREVIGLRKDGSTFPLDLAVSEFHDGVRRLFSGIMRDSSERKALEKEVLEIAAREQQRIGQDLHDSVGQELTGLGLMAEHLVELLAGDASPQAELAGKFALGLKRALNQVRVLSRGLTPVDIDGEGLMSALADLAERIGKESGVQCTFECDEPIAIRDNFKATHLYRITQEAVANALKHSQTSNIRISLLAEDRRAKIKISDDGVGMPEPPTSSSGVGLKIMRYRAGLINAALTIDSAPGNGTIVTCSFLQEEDDHGHESIVDCDPVQSPDR